MIFMQLRGLPCCHIETGLPYFLQDRILGFPDYFLDFLAVILQWSRQYCSLLTYLVLREDGGRSWRTGRCGTWPRTAREEEGVHCTALDCSPCTDSCEGLGCGTRNCRPRTGAGVAGAHCMGLRRHRRLLCHPVSSRLLTTRVASSHLQHSTLVRTNITCVSEPKFFWGFNLDFLRLAMQILLCLKVLLLQIQSSQSHHH